MIAMPSRSHSKYPEKRGGLDIRPAVTVEAGAGEATCGEAGISFALFENVRAVVCHWRISAMHRDEKSVSNHSGSISKRSTY